MENESNKKKNSAFCEIFVGFFFSRDFLFFSSDGFSKGFPLERNGWLIGTTMNGHEDGDDRCEQE